MNLPPLVLASKSPRRQQLLQQAGFNFRLIHQDVNENYEEKIDKIDVPIILAKRKARAVINQITNHEIIVSADTIVLLNNKIYNKPKDIKDAKEMLHDLSGKMHEVITGVCLLSKEKEVVFSEITKVYFNQLSEHDIDYYATKHNVLDKAGAYGIQDWIGLIGIKRIEGCYFNAMGLPMSKLYENIISLQV